MEERVVLIAPDSTILNVPETQKLYTYTNGGILVRTSAPLSSGEMPVEQGLQIEGVSEDDVQSAHEQLTALQALNLTDALPILAYIELIGPVDPQWLQILNGLGVQPLHYQPHNSYLCRGQVSAFNEADKQSFVLRIIPLIDTMKPKHEALSAQASDVSLLIHATQEDGPAIITTLNALPGVEINADQEIEHIGPYLRMRAKISPDGQNTLLQEPTVRAIEPYQRAKPEDEVANLILAGQYNTTGQPDGSYLHWLENQGINGEGVTIGIVDQGVDASHPAFHKRIVDLSNGLKSWHGTFVAGHAAGCYLQEKDGRQFIYGLGVAAASELLVQSNAETTTFLCKQTVTEKGPSGVVGSIQNNSWGKGLQDPMDYRLDEYTYDQLVRNADPQGKNPAPLIVCFSSGNSGKAGLTRPKAAKNILVTGNSQNYRPDIGGDQSNNIASVYTGSHPSSWGNCADGRIRPHVVAPGEWTASANYDSRKGDPEYISPHLTWGGGSSGASPKTAGACALLSQWWRLHNADKELSPAMARALIVNGAEAMLTGGPIPNMIQGWGRLNLANILSEDVRHTYVDQTMMLTQPGEQRIWNIRVSDNSKPLKITLAWTDPGGPPQSGTAKVDAIVNKLCLTAEINGKFYLGGWRQEHFQNGWSVATSSDNPVRVDNLQNIYLPAGLASGVLKITVMALNITTNCLTGEVDIPQQDFALVISNGALDTNSAPTDVFITVDAAAQTQEPPTSPENYWQDTTGNNDAAELHAETWQAMQAGTDNAPVAETHGPSNKDNWWNRMPPTLLQSGVTGTPTPSSLIKDSAFVTHFKAGLDLLTTTGAARVIPVSSQQTTVPIDQNTSVVNTSETNLTQALATLITNWDTFGTTSTDNSLMRKRVAVLIVGHGTRVSRADIAAMRKLTFLGELYLIAKDPAILSFLAQRIYRRSGIHLRLATNTTELAQITRDTLAEIGGAQRLDIKTTVTNASTHFISTHIFNVIEADTHLTILLQTEAGIDPNEIKLHRPGLDALLLNSQLSDTSLQVVDQSPGMRITIAVPLDGQHWSGEWTLELAQSQAPTKDKNVVTVLAQGGLPLLLRKDEIAQDEKQVLVALSGDPGITFQSCVISPPRIATAQPLLTEENEREIIITTQPSRLELESAAQPMSDDAESEATASPGVFSSASLSQWLPFQRPPIGAAVFDITTRSTGIDTQGNLFSRIAYANLIELELRSDWRKRLVEQAPLLVISARIKELLYDAKQEKIVGLRLYNGDQQRDVSVPSALLGEYLADLGLDCLKERDLLFVVSDNSVIKIIRMIETATNHYTKNQLQEIEPLYSL